TRVLAHRMSDAGQAVPRSVPLEDAFVRLLPPLDFRTSGPVLAAVFAAVVSRDRTPPAVALDHRHHARVSVPEQRALAPTRLRGQRRVDFASPIEDAESRLVVVARFLAVLELCTAGLCDVDQPEPLDALTVALTGDGDATGAGTAPAQEDQADAVPASEWEDDDD